MNFRKELNSIKEIKNDKISKTNKYEAEYILKEIVIAYLRYLIALEQNLGKIELVFAVQSSKRNVLEIIVKSVADNYTGKVIYRKYFPKKKGAMITAKKFQKIFDEEKFEIKPYENNPGYTKYYEKRFSVFIEF